MVTTLLDLRKQGMPRKENIMAQRRTAKQIPRSEAAGAARIYADPKNTCTYRELMQILEASKGTVYTVLDNAVIQHMVDDKVVQQMEEKARFNEDRLHEGKGTRRTEVHYNVLREKRKKYELSEKAAIQIIMMYAETDETRQEFCEREGISKELFNKIMMQYIVTKKVFFNMTVRLHFFRETTNIIHHFS